MSLLGGYRTRRHKSDRTIRSFALPSETPSRSSSTPSRKSPPTHFFAGLLRLSSSSAKR